MNGINQITLMGMYQNGIEILKEVKGRTTKISSVKGQTLFSKNDFGIELPINEYRNTEINVLNKTLIIKSNDMMAIYKIN